MSEKDLLRIAVIERVIAGKTSAREAANAEGVSLRQIRRQIRACSHFTSRREQTIMTGMTGSSALTIYGLIDVTRRRNSSEEPPCLPLM